VDRRGKETYSIISEPTLTTSMALDKSGEINGQDLKLNPTTPSGVHHIAERASCYTFRNAQCYDAEHTGSNRSKLECP
jgi:hypothetical protein